MEQIQKLFQQRDIAVKTKDVALFEATQLNETAGPPSSQYFAVDAIQTEILTQADDTVDLTKVIFVKETYFTGNTPSHHNFVIYGLVNTIAGWKIHTITPAFYRMGPWRNKFS